MKFDKVTSFVFIKKNQYRFWTWNEVTINQI